MAKEYVKQAVSSDGTRTISAQRGFSWQRFLFQWEWMLVLMLILVNVFNISASPYYAHAKSILNATRDFLDKAIVVFPMAFVLMLGEIDISVASIMALSATIMGVAFDAGVPMIEAIGLALVTGTVCGVKYDCNTCNSDNIQRNSTDYFGNQFGRRISELVYTNRSRQNRRNGSVCLDICYI